MSRVKFFLCYLTFCAVFLHSEYFLEVSFPSNDIKLPHLPFGPDQAKEKESDYENVSHSKLEPKIIVVSIDQSGQGKKDFEEYREFPISYDGKGNALKTERKGVGYSAEVYSFSKLNKSSAQLEFSIDSSLISGWYESVLNGVKLRRPIWNSQKIPRTEMSLRLGVWTPVGESIRIEREQAEKLGIIKVRIVEK